MSSEIKIDPNRIPRHIAVIMDGNGRWAKKKGMPRIFGHRSGVKAVREITESAAEIGVEYLTLYAFSTENWSRPPAEVTALMHLLVDTVRGELEALTKNNIRLSAIGELEKLPSKTYQALKDGIEKTKHHDRMTLNLALNYSSRWEITRAVSEIAQKVKDGKLEQAEITEDIVSQHMVTNGIPDPELLIRTSGEHRVSNYLLWQLAYTEFYFMDIFWPEFKKQHLHEAIAAYQNRERRFGKTSEQVIQ